MSKQTDLSEYELGFLLSTMSPGSAAMTMGRSQAWVERKREELKNGARAGRLADDDLESESITPAAPALPAPSSFRRKADPAELRRLYVDEGLSCKAISERLGTISDVGVRKALERGGVPLKSKSTAQPSRIDRTDVLARLASGDTPAKVARQLGVGVEAIWKIRRESDAAKKPPASARLSKPLGSSETAAEPKTAPIPYTFGKGSQDTSDGPVIASGPVEEVIAIFADGEPFVFDARDTEPQNCRCVLLKAAPTPEAPEIPSRVMRFVRWFVAARWRIKDIAHLFDLDEPSLREALKGS